MPKQKKSSGKEVQLTEENPYTACTILQRRYVEARMQGLAPAAARRAAGAKDTNLETSPKVRAAIKYLVNESTKRAEDLTKSDVMTGMLEAVEAAATSTELVNAWRELGKLIGAYEPERKVLEIHDYTKEELKTMSDEELVRLSGSKYEDAIDGEFYEVEDRDAGSEASAET